MSKNIFQLTIQSIECVHAWTCIMACVQAHMQCSQEHYNSYKLSFPMGMINRYTISEVPIDKSTVAMQKIVLTGISSSRAQEYLLAQSECDQDEPQLEQYLLMHQILPPLLHGLKMASEGHSHCLTGKEDHRDCLRMDSQQQRVIPGSPHSTNIHCGLICLANTIYVLCLQ